MRMQTELTLKDGTSHKDIVRAKNTEEAILRFISTKDIPSALCGFAHPLGQRRPKQEDCRQDISCSVTGEVSMSKIEPSLYNKWYRRG